MAVPGARRRQRQHHGMALCGGRPLGERDRCRQQHGAPRPGPRPEPHRAVLKRMAAAVKPGGWLLVQEPDFHLAPTTEPAAWATTWKAPIEWGTPTGSTGSSAGRCRAWSASSVSGDPRRTPTSRTSVAGIAERCLPAVLRRGARSCGRQRTARRGDPRRRLGVAGRPRLLDAVLDDDGGVGAQAGRVSSCDSRPTYPSAYARSRVWLHTVRA